VKKLYFDNCCFSRPFDDLTQEKISLEEKAIEDILTKYERQELEIYTSKIVDFEMSKIKDPNKKRQVEDLYGSLRLKKIPYSQAVKQRAVEIEGYNIKTIDALHIAIAESINIDYLITTDKLLINGAKRTNSKVNVISPISFIMEVE